MNSGRLAAIVTTASLLIMPVACSSSTSDQIAGTAGASAVVAGPGSGRTAIGVGQIAEFPSDFSGEQGTIMRLTVTKVAYPSSILALGSTEAPSRGVFVRVTMTATNVGGHPGLFDCANFVWVSASGEVFPNPATAGAEADTVPAVTLQPGQHVSGIATYDVPAKGGKLEYLIYNDQPPAVTINLPTG